MCVCSQLSGKILGVSPVGCPSGFSVIDANGVDFSSELSRSSPGLHSNMQIQWPFALQGKRWVPVLQGSLLFLILVLPQEVLYRMGIIRHSRLPSTM